MRSATTMTKGSHSSWPSHLQGILKLSERNEEEEEKEQEEEGHPCEFCLFPFLTMGADRRAPIKINACAAFLVTVRSSGWVDVYLVAFSERRKTFPSRVVNSPRGGRSLGSLFCASHPLFCVRRTLVVVLRESFSSALFSLDHSPPRSPWLGLFFFVAIFCFFFFFFIMEHFSLPPRSLKNSTVFRFRISYYSTWKLDNDRNITNRKWWCNK